MHHIFTTIPLSPFFQLDTISKRGGIDIAQKIKEQDNNVLNIKENNPRGPEFDKVVSTAKEILDKLVPKAHANEELDLRTSYALLKILSKNEVNDRIRGNLKKMNQKFGRFLNEIIIYKDVGKKKQIYSIMDDVENLLDVLSGPKMTEKQYREAVKKIEEKLGKKKQ
uniref:Ribosome-binding factor A n=1 Tax=Bursaphelenchus xylophilus TaxID=6326 RepID=A0A1I7SIL4_BURXY